MIMKKVWTIITFKAKNSISLKLNEHKRWKVDKFKRQ